MSIGYNNILLKLEFNGISYDREKRIFIGQEINLKIDFFNQPIIYPHQFLNEAKLSAITLSIYLRTAFETEVQKFCNKKRLNIPYKDKFKEISINEFWKAIKEQKPKKNNGELYIDDLLAFDVELYRAIILNPLSHNEIANIPKREIQEAIDLIKKLQQIFLEK